MMVQGTDAINNERFNQQLCFNSASESEPMHIPAEPKPEVLRDMPSPSASEKKGFLGGLLRRGSVDKVVVEKERKKSSTGLLSNIFKKSGDTDIRKSQDNVVVASPAQQAGGPLKRSQDDIDTDAYLLQLKDMDGRTDEEIAALMASIVQKEPTKDVTLSSPNIRKKNSSGVKEFFQAMKEDILGAPRREEMIYYPEIPTEAKELTVSISAAPFFAAPPPEHDMSFAELATFEPVYLGSGCCINNLPVKKYDGTPLPGDQHTCPICISAFEKKEELKSLPCVHFFHRECIDRWLMVGHNCPCCKALVL